MSGDKPALHLTRKGTIRLLENFRKAIPEIKLSDNLHNPPQHFKKQYSRSYSSVVSDGNENKKMSSEQNNKHIPFTSNRRGCFNCGELNHVISQCKFSQKIRCRRCHYLGHKERHCRTKTDG